MNILKVYINVPTEVNQLFDIESQPKRRKIMSESALALLERMAPPAKEITASSFWVDLPEKAEGLLGYQELSSQKSTLNFRKTLHELGVAPFSVESVEKYKELRVKMSKRLLPDSFIATIYGLSAITFLLSAGPAILGWPFGWFSSSATIGHYFVWTCIVSVVACFALMVYGITRSDVWLGRWRATPLKGYSQPVPEFALLTAIKVKERFSGPEVEMFVHEFVRVENEKVVLDPFLVARHQNKDYFIAVWDESRFEAEQKV
ncbi:MAG: hypothetical protein A2644_02720 [Candidatus Zambryskibacteria bacterium RIFCSPHIGHO2_01_FULL_39_63]|nr:MAG: hypothetical protein A2644_02720 [Candidatus Zambryskibacteria bacterium RIFCSPHIGHO2_01_FULL_39_63]OHA94378.1 MAG: hypothetical protein A3B88_01595 [Candidatus Zambryskibacteria bacterium RIFCSPHIGHO2_02_FULL_39_19]OHA97928.1 MAG: hypothetical protein A3F20_00630 [Candidatus Zambryskibacteria bacterium RIFCSPHIGHO2_12_FULL_39_21]